MADFTNIDGIYAKDTELRSGIDTLRTAVLSNTIKPLTVTKNGTYTAIPSSGTYGYSPITVDVVEEPWQPLQDSYSNFWFELDNDTLSPWLNFSAKTENAVIDWGDGSGEQALDTLTPTHTYSKAGRYIVKCKGVTGIAAQQYQGVYMKTLKHIELNSEITTIASYGLQFCIGLEDVIMPSTITLGTASFRYCSSLKKAFTTSIMNTNAYGYNFSISEVEFYSGTAVLPVSCFTYCASLSSITIPSTITGIDSAGFQYCTSLMEIHMQATAPPTLGTNVFNALPSNFIIYVPTGTGDTYKSAEGWSAYADHIVEEGQTLSNAALRRIQAEKNDNGEEMR